MFFGNAIKFFSPIGENIAELIKSNIISESKKQLAEIFINPDYVNKSSKQITGNAMARIDENMQFIKNFNKEYETILPSLENKNELNSKLKQIPNLVLDTITEQVKKTLTPETISQLTINSFNGVKSLIVSNVPLIQLGAGATIFTGSNLLTGGAISITAVLLIAVISKVRQQHETHTEIVNMLDEVELICSQLLNSILVLQELAAFFDISLPDETVEDIQNRLNSIAVCIVSISSPTRFQLIKNFMSSNNIKSTIITNLTMINSHFNILFAQVDLMLREKELMSTLYKFDVVYNNGEWIFVKEPNGGTQKLCTIDNPTNGCHIEYTNYEDAYLFWAKNSKYYKNMKLTGTIESIKTETNDQKSTSFLTKILHGVSSDVKAKIDDEINKTLDNPKFVDNCVNIVTSIIGMKGGRRNLKMKPSKYTIPGFNVIFKYLKTTGRLLSKCNHRTTARRKRRRRKLSRRIRSQ